MSTMPVSFASVDHHRQQFPGLLNKRYFNFGGQGPLPERAIAAMQQAHAYIQEIGPFSNAVNQWITADLAQTRGAIAQLLHVAPATITLTENVSIGCDIPLWGIDWREGDHILLSDCEHPGVVMAAEAVRQRFGVKISTCPVMATLNDGDPVAVVAHHLRPTTRLVILSHVLWNTGQVLPLREIVAACHAYPAQGSPVQVLVDAAQSVGVLPLNLAETGVDFYAFTGHKWLCGPAGLGGLYVSPEARATLRPTYIGWRGITKDANGESIFHPDGRRFEIATSDYPLGGALREAIALHDAWGTDQDRYQRMTELSRYLWEQLCTLPQVRCLRTAPPESGLVSFQLTGMNHSHIVQALEHRGFMLRTLAHPDCIRACTHYLTLESEIDALMEAMQQVLATGE